MSNKNIEIKQIKAHTLNKVNQGVGLKMKLEVDFSAIDPSYVGTIMMHMPSEMENIQIGVLRSSLLGGMEVDVSTHNRAHVISTLDVVVDEKPEWFDAGNVNISFVELAQVYEAFEEWENSFRSRGTRDNNTGVSEDSVSKDAVVDTEEI